MSESKEEMQTTIEQLQGQLDDIRDLIEADQKIEKTEYPITVRYHALSELRDNAYEVLER